MKPFTEIVEANMVDGGFDIANIIKQAAEEMGTIPTLNVEESFALLDGHYAYAVTYLGNIILSIADQIGALPDGPEEAAEDLALALELDKMRRLYQYKAAQSEKKIVVPNVK